MPDVAKKIKEADFLQSTSFIYIIKRIYASIAATPGSTLPSIASSNAPPPVEI